MTDKATNRQLDTDVGGSQKQTNDPCCNSWLVGWPKQDCFKSLSDKSNKELSHTTSEAPVHVAKSVHEEVISDPDFDEAEVQNMLKKPGLKESCMISEPAEVLTWGHNAGSTSNLSAEGTAMRSQIQAASKSKDKHSVGTSSSHPFGFLGLHKHNKVPNEPISPFTQHPLILTAEPHSPSTTPLTKDNTASSTGPHLPVFRKLSSHRPPPCSPPEPVTQEQLSMPTLPSLHVTSVPALIEQYRKERRPNPTAFDTYTQQIKRSLVQAKIHRGGVDFLLDNEITAELASRLDAEAIERWSTVRLHDEIPDDDQGDSDGEGEVQLDAGGLSVGPTTTRSVGHKTVITKETYADGREQFVYETYIKVTQMVEVVDKGKGKGKAVFYEDRHAQTGDAGDNQLEEIIDGLVKLRSEKGEQLDEEFLETLEETKMRSSALRES